MSFVTAEKRIIHCTVHFPFSKSIVLSLRIFLKTFRAPFLSLGHQAHESSRLQTAQHDSRLYM